jgi:osmotically-inducible protein OsmY
MRAGSGNDVHVTLANNRSVLLTGTVPSQADRQRAEQIARTLANGHAVTNQIAITGNRQNARPKASSK